MELKQLNVKIAGLEREIKLAEGEIEANDGKLKYFKAQVTAIANSDDDAKTAGRRLKQLVDQCERQAGLDQRDPAEEQDTTKEVNEEL